MRNIKYPECVELVFLIDFHTPFEDFETQGQFLAYLQGLIICYTKTPIFKGIFVLSF